jgi:hypothetical protein
MSKETVSTMVTRKRPPCSDMIEEEFIKEVTDGLASPPILE